MDQDEDDDETARGSAPRRFISLEAVRLASSLFLDAFLTTYHLKLCFLCGLTQCRTHDEERTTGDGHLAAYAAACVLVAAGDDDEADTHRAVRTPKGTSRGETKTECARRRALSFRFRGETLLRGTPPVDLVLVRVPDRFHSFRFYSR